MQVEIDKKVVEELLNLEKFIKKIDEKIDLLKMKSFVEDEVEKIKTMREEVNEFLNKIEKDYEFVKLDSLKLYLDSILIDLSFALNVIKTVCSSRILIDCGILSHESFERQMEIAFRIFRKIVLKIEKVKRIVEIKNKNL